MNDIEMLHKHTGLAKDLEMICLTETNQRVSVMIHELAQPIQVIRSIAERLLKGGYDASPIMFERLLSQVDGMTTILEQANNGIPIPNLQPTYLNPVIRETLELVCIAKRPAIRTSLDLDDDVILNIDKNQIAQVLTNLIRNAIEAMQNSGQNLRIKTTHLSNGIEIAVIDDGPGIDPAVADHLFEPFVTSKLTGAGIGLSISLGVVKAHHGELSLRVTNDNCTWFVIYLPK